MAVALAVVAALAWTAPDPETIRLLSITRVPGAGRRWWASRLTRLVRRPDRRRLAAAWRRTSIELCQAIVAELASGRTPGEAMARAASSLEPPDPAVLRPVIAAARDGGDVAGALQGAVPAHGGEGLLGLAACWRVSVTVGGGLTALVERVGQSLREAEAHRAEVAAQLAGPRSTARLLAVLPVLGVLLAAGLGLRPFSFLVGSPAGLACLAVGVLLDLAGVAWTNRLVARAERTGA
ncbi:type II secretion system F family protein [Sphaerisporangium fuscum]|uniref:type II secretion system F family protein n=1 Tax=Sphaerisporangium fuscum TaxID=2835868 RepID=UPI001BDC476F|nr:type II secretion system F family protein [Sphaerisporangium fuscum]